MDIDDVREWFQIADDDFYSAQILNDQTRKPIGMQMIYGIHINIE